MEALPTQLLAKLDFVKAAQLERASRRNLIPPDPDWTRVTDFEQVIASQTEAALAMGSRFNRAVTVSSRKAQHGFRPVPFLGVVERVAYRALTEYVLAAFPPLKREPEDWLAFSKAPAEYGETQRRRSAKGTPRRSTFDLLFDSMPWVSTIKYVVKSDVTAFYDHVDHAILQDQLIGRGAPYLGVQHLIALLHELQGRPLGLPQLFDASDMLSEVYVDQAERQLLARGLSVWRFNDDFRIACRNYTDVLRCTEELDTSLRRLSLTMNESKTTTPKFATYYLDVLDLEVSKGKLVDRQDVEDLVGDYTDDYSQDADSAASFLQRLTESSASDSQIDVRELTAQQTRLIKRAFNGLAHHGDPRGLEHALLVVRFAGSLTPTVIRYLVALTSAKGNRLASRMKVLDSLTQKAATNDWQDIWIIHGLLDAGKITYSIRLDERLSWLRRRMIYGASPILRAYATRALAMSGQLSIAEVLSRAEGEPESVQLLYADGARSLSTGPADEKVLRAAYDLNQFLQKFVVS